MISEIGTLHCDDTAVVSADKAGDVSVSDIPRLLSRASAGLGIDDLRSAGILSGVAK